MQGDQDTNKLNPFLNQLSNSFAGPLHTNLMALNISNTKSLKDELRVSKKQEQLTKDKYLETKKILEQTQEAQVKYKVDAEQRLESLRSENTVLHLTIKHLNEKNELIEKSSKDSQESPDVLRLIDEYSRTNEQKSKEIQDLVTQAAIKKQKHQALKKITSEQQQRILRLSSNLENLKKFSKIFIKSMQMQNQSLKQTVENCQRDFQHVIQQTKSQIQQSIEHKIFHLKAQYETRMSAEQQNAQQLQQKILQLESGLQETVSQQQYNTQISQLTQKNDRLRQKVASLKESLTDEDSQAQQAKVIQIKLEQEQLKFQLQLQDRARVVQALEDQVKMLQQREDMMNLKIEQSGAKQNMDIQKFMELYESNSRFKDMKDLYEEKLQMKEQQVIDGQQEIAKLEVKLDYQIQKVQEISTLKIKKEHELLQTLLQQEVLIENFKHKQSENCQEYDKLEKTVQLLKQKHEDEVNVLRANFEQVINNLKQNYQEERQKLIQAQGVELKNKENTFISRVDQMLDYKRAHEQTIIDKEFFQSKLQESYQTVKSLQNEIQELKLSQNKTYDDHKQELSKLNARIIEQKEIFEQNLAAQAKPQTQSQLTQTDFTGLVFKNIQTEQQGVNRSCSPIKELIVDMGPKPNQVRPNLPKVPRIPTFSQIPEQETKTCETVQQPVKPRTSCVETPRIEATPRTQIDPAITRIADIVQKDQTIPKTQNIVEDQPKPTTKPVNPAPMAPAPTETVGIFSIFNSLFGLITKKKQAYQGRPASAMYYDEKKKRWIIDGENESDDDVPPPPPPKAQPKVEELQLQPKQEEAKGLDSLTQPVFGGALANRNRNRKALQTQPQKVIEEVKQIPQQDQNDETFLTAFNDTMNMTTMTANLNQTMIDGEREEQWSLKFKQQSEKITQMRHQNQHLQDELRREKIQSQQTIAELETFSKVISAEGQSLQQHINELNDKLGKQGDSVAMSELKRWQAEDSLLMSESELEQARQLINSLKQKVFALELKEQMSKLQNHPVKTQQISLTQYEEVQDRCETLLWRLSAEEQRCSRVQLFADRQKQDLHDALTQLNKIRADQQTQYLLYKETLKNLERDRDTQIKEATSKANLERDKVEQQMRTTVYQRDLKIKKYEQQHAQDQADFQMKIHEQQNLWQQRLYESNQKQESEITALKELVTKQADQLKSQQKLEAVRTKTHLKQLEDVLSKKDMDLQTVLGKHDEAQQELQSMSDMRQKLNEHILYLQNEIRKRDELLENTSDFEEDESLADQSVCSGQGRAASVNESTTVRKRKNPLAKQLDESRNQLRQLVDSNLNLKKDNADLLSQLQRLQCGFEDLCQIIDGQPITITQDQDLVHQAIQKYFNQRSELNSQILTQKHEIDNLQLRCEENENLKFDIELLTQERDMMQNELVDAYQTISDQEISQKQQSSQQIQILRDQISQQTQEHEDYKVKVDKQISLLRQQLKAYDDSSNSEIAMLNQKIQSYQVLVGNLQQNSENLQVRQDQHLNQVKQLQSRIGELAHEKQKQETRIEQLLNQNQNLESQIEDLNQIQQDLQAQFVANNEQTMIKRQQVDQLEERIACMGQECDEMAQAFLEKKQDYRDQIKRLKQDSTELRSQLEQAESMIEQMKETTEQIVKRLDDKRKAKESDLKDRVNQITQKKNDEANLLRQENKKLQEQILSLKTQYQVCQEQFSQQIETLKNEKIDVLDKLSEAQKQLDSNDQQEQLRVHEIQQDADTVVQRLQEKREAKEAKLKSQIQELQLVVQQLQEQSSMIQQQSTDAIKSLKSDRSVMKQKIKELDFEIAKKNQLITQLQQEVEGKHEQNQNLQNQAADQQELERLKQQLRDWQLKFQDMETEYQQESQNLAQVFKEKRERDKEKQSQIKSEFKNLLSSYQQLEQNLKETTENRDEVLRHLQELQREKLELSQSLDLTRVQCRRDQSVYESERAMLESTNGHHYDILKKTLQKFLDCDAKDFDELLETLDSFLSGYQEDKLCLKTMISDRDELQEEVNSLVYKMQILGQEREQLAQYVKMSQGDQLKQRLKQLEEERSELRNDFVIKIEDLSNEVSTLKSKLRIYEKDEQPLPKQNASKETSYKLEQDLKPQKSKPGYFASFFLTDSEMGQV